MVNKLLLLLLIFRGGLTLAQNPPSFYENQIPRTDYFPMEACNTSDVTQVQEFLEKHLNCNLVLSHTATSQFSTVYTFEQFKNGLEVYLGFVKVIVEKNSGSFLVINNLFNELPEGTSNKPGACWYYFMHNWIIATKTKEFNKEDGTLNEIITGENNEIISIKDLALHAQPIDTMIRVKVFNPDPLTSAHKTYGTPYLDNNDKDTVALRTQRVWKNVMATFNKDTFWLRNKYLVPFAYKISTPYDPVYRLNDTFDYNRNEHEFEDVMVMYHVTTFQDYINSIGYPGIGFRPTLYDAHGELADQSGFYPGEGLEFGTGGIDDAEDGEVIVHEYSHSLREFVSPGTFNGHERMSVEEGFMDYLSTSYKMNIDSFGWKKWAFWDGNNPAESWYGRNVASSKMYPDAFTGDKHEDGEIWSSAMMRIFLKLGRTVTDKLAIQTFYYLSANLSMTQTALLVIKADSVLFNGIHHDTLYNTFAETHILPWHTGINSSTSGNQIKLINSLNFMKGNGTLFVYLPDEVKGTYTITNNVGQVISQDNFYSNYFSLPAGKIKTPGIYYLMITTATYTSTRKIIIQ